MVWQVSDDEIETDKRKLCSHQAGGEIVSDLAGRLVIVKSVWWSTLELGPSQYTPVLATCQAGPELRQPSRDGS